MVLVLGSECLDLVVLDINWVSADLTRCSLCPHDQCLPSARVAK